MESRPYRFTDSPIMKADARLRLLREWISFLENDLAREKFSWELYAYLTRHCGFKTRGGEDNFYKKFFTTPEGVELFLKQFDLRGQLNGADTGDEKWRNAPGLQELQQALVEEGSLYIPALLVRIRLKEAIAGWM